MKNKIIENYKSAAGIQQEFGVEIGTACKIKDFIIKALSQQREDIIKEMIELSDKIEEQYETKFDEWKAFKHFRNKMRDILKAINIPQ